MTLPNEGPGGSDPNAGGGGGSESNKFISREAYEKSVTQEKNLRNQLRETQEKLLIFENEKRSIEEQKLLDEKKHVEYIEKLKAENQQLLQKTQSLEQDRADFRKLNAAQQLMQQKGIQLEPQYFGLLPLNNIELTGEGAVDLTSLTRVVDAFQKEHPRLVAPAKAFLPSDKPGSSANQMSVDEWKSLPTAKERTEALQSGRVKHGFNFGSGKK